MVFQKANLNDFERIKNFYWDLIDEMQDQNDVIGWKKGVYPTDAFLQDSLRRGELFTLEEGGQLYACAVLNSASNEGYAGIPWHLNCRDDEVLIPHALGVRPAQQGKGIGRRIVEEILQYAKGAGKRPCGWISSARTPPRKSCIQNADFSSYRPRPCFTRTPAGRSSKCMSTT